ncbi:MAG TPA: orotate phosphoribosyltransferase [Patescibacteria group bacterium]|jgi:orotate phosphoribosyltransferase|nr:orotate phosphoribosyltransferase [Patescibacteria group bacterium]
MTPDNPATRRSRLLALLRERAVTFGDYTLASGRKSKYYIDGRLVTLHPEGAYLIARVILDLMEREGIEAEAVGGLTMGADPIAAAVSVVSHLESRPLSAFIVRKEAKEHGTGRKVEGGLRRGAPVLVVDDVVTTAGSTLQAIRAVEEIGCKVAGVVCIIDREEGGAQALRGYRFHPLFRVAELLEREGASPSS